MVVGDKGEDFVDRSGWQRSSRLDNTSSDRDLGSDEVEGADAVVVAPATLGLVPLGMVERCDGSYET